MKGNHRTLLWFCKTFLQNIAKAFRIIIKIAKLIFFEDIPINELVVF